MGKAVTLLATKFVGEPVPVTVMFTAAVPPAAAVKVATPPSPRVKVWLVAVTVRLMVVGTFAVPLVLETVIACAPEGRAMLAVVEMLTTTFTV